MRKHIWFILFFTTCVLCEFTTEAQTGVIYTVTGGGTSTSDGVPAINEHLTCVMGIAMDAAGNTYVADRDENKIRKVDHATGSISTIAGNGISGFSGDGGPATNATLNSPMSICLDGTGNIYIADYGNSRIRKVSAGTGIITTIAGGGSSTADGVPAITAAITPQCVVLDHGGNLYTGSVNKIRKINPVSGNISTVAGDGTPGDGGDGGQAINATITGGPVCLAIDAVGDLYFVSNSRNRVRKIDALSGYINTFAGGGSSISDGVPAYNESIGDIRSIGVDPAGNLYIGEVAWGPTIRKVDATTYIIKTIAGGGTSAADGVPATAASIFPDAMYLDIVNKNIYFSTCSTSVRRFNFPQMNIINTFSSVKDSFLVLLTAYCNGPDLSVITQNYVPGRSIKTFYGDGTSDSGTLIYYAGMGQAKFSHTYLNSGNYSIRNVLFNGSHIDDTVSYSYGYAFCRSLPVKFYYDMNMNCMKDANELYSAQPVVTEVDSNGVAIDTVSATSGFLYNAYSMPGDIYSFKMLPATGNLVVVCPAVGIIKDTILASAISYPAKYFGLACASAATFDLAVNAVIPVTGRNDQWGNIYVRNNSCYPINADVTLHYSQKYNYDITSPASSSSASGTITWRIASVSADVPNPVQLYYVVRTNPIIGLVAAGDTVWERIEVTPTTGDGYVANNFVIKEDTVKASCDPNEISVSPAGCIASGNNPLQLEYTINFENTGTDTAHNIYVLDTLPAYVDPHSLRIVMASAVMNIDIQKHVYGYVVRFDFPDINLLDSSHHNECNGAVIFTISTKAGLPEGADIMNRAGIYFDYNDVVMTNTIDNTIGCPQLSIPEIGSTPRVHIFPNPATDELTVKMDKDAYQSLSITNTIGQQIIQQQVTNSQTKVNVMSLPAGVYYITLKGERGSRVEKFIKW